jgi:hypothetical protein
MACHELVEWLARLSPLDSARHTRPMTVAEFKKK